MELLEEIRERLKDCPNFEVYAYGGEIYARATKPYRFFKVLDLEGLDRLLYSSKPHKTLKLTKQHLECLQEIK